MLLSFFCSSGHASILTAKTSPDTTHVVDKCMNDWVLNKADVLRNLLESMKGRKLTYLEHVMRSNSESLEKH